jgi:cytoskeletal protein CcmA (bactofilin family)
MSEPADPVSQRRPDGTMDHLDEITCLMYAERQLDRARAQAVSAHAQDCAACRTLLRALERESRLLTRAMLEADEPLPAKLAHFQERTRASLQWIWGLVFGLAATGLYEVYTAVSTWTDRLENAGLGGTSLLNLLIVQGAFWKGWQSVITVLEALAMVTLVGFGAIILRRRIGRRGSALALVLASFCALMILPTAASATEFRKGDRITIGADEVIHGDVYAAGGRVRVEGKIDGDLIVGAGEIEVAGHVLGDVISSSGTMRVTGQVDGNIRSYAGNMTIKGKVGHNVMIAGGDLNIDRDAVIGGSVSSFGGHLTMDGQVGHDVLAMGGAVTISGTLSGGATVRSGELNFDSTAVVKGPVDFEGDNPADISPGAKLASPVHFTKLKHGPDYNSSSYYVWRVIWMAAYILFGLALFKVMPDFSRECVGMADRYGPSLGLGILAGPGVFVGGCIACVTVVGLFIGVSTLFLLWGALYYAQVIAATMVGQWILGRSKENWPLIGRMALGMVIVRLSFVIPHAGFWLKLFVLIWGMGAITLALYSRFQPKIPAAHAAPFQPVPVAAGPAL